MTIKHGNKKEFQPGNGYSKDDWDAVNSPELSDEELARMKPAKDVLPAAFFAAIEAKRGRGRPKVEHPKQAVTLRVDQEVLDKFQSFGGDWRSRMNDALRKAAGL